MTSNDTGGVQLLESKLHVPRRRRGLVARPRLAARLDRAALPAVVLVSAPAGFGKTTFLTEWLADDATPSAWLSLDRRDNDPAVFWTYVLHALRKINPEVGAQSLTTMHSTPSALESIVGSLLNDVAPLAGDTVLVLDDYHVIENGEVHESMRFLVEHLPANLHLVIASRADPRLPLAALRARGDLVEVRAADLRFTAEEAAAYLHDAMDLDLSPADVGTLEARTEGWIAALQLAALSLQGRDDPSAFIAQFAGDDRFVVDYLLDEVLDRQTEDIRTFLLETSILSQLTAALCDAVTGRSSAKATLDVLERSNLFLVPLDDRRRWYRYHHLFADVLRVRLLDNTPERLADLHLRACDWLAANGDRGEAIRHAMAAEDFAKAAELIELAIPEWRKGRQDATSREALDALPREVFANRPVLTLALIGSHMNVGDTDGIDELLDGVERLLALDRSASDMIVHDVDEFRRVPAQTAMYRAGLALLRGDLTSTVAHGERAASLVEPDDHFEQGAAAALVGLARWTTGDLDAAAHQYATAIAAFKRASFVPDVLGCSLGLADIQFAQGRLADATRTLTTAVEIAGGNTGLRGAADIHVALAELHIERNELDAASEQLQTSLDLGDRAAGAQHPYRWRVVAARLRAAAGDYDSALPLLEEAERLYNTDYSPTVRPVTATTARMLVAMGDLDAAARWAARAGVTADDDAVYVREYEHLTYARLLVASNRADEATGLLQRLLTAAEAGGREGSAIEAQLLLALARTDAGDTSAALRRAKSAGFVRLCIEIPALVSRRSPSDARTSQGMVDELSSRELQVLRLLRSELSGPEMAAQLVVSLNTVRTHTKNIFMKLGVNSRRAAVRRADELGL